MSELIKTFLIIVVPFLLLIGAIIYRHNINNCPKPPVIEEIKPKNDTIYIIGLGRHQKSDLKKASKIVKNFYGYTCKIIEGVKTTEYMYSENHKSLDDYKTLSYLRSDKITLYITDESITQDLKELRGSTLVSSNNMIVQGDLSFMESTIIHEFGHLLGLEHCNNLTCVMALDNDDYDSGDYCVKCKKLIKYPNI